MRVIFKRMYGERTENQEVRDVDVFLNGKPIRELKIPVGDEIVVVQEFLEHNIPHKDKQQHKLMIINLFLMVGQYTIVLSDFSLFEFRGRETPALYLYMPKEQFEEYY